MTTALWIIGGLIALAGALYILYLGFVLLLIFTPALLVIERWMGDVHTGDILDTWPLRPIRWIVLWIVIKRSTATK